MFSDETMRNVTRTAVHNSVQQTIASSLSVARLRRLDNLIGEPRKDVEQALREEHCGALTRPHALPRQAHASPGPPPLTAFLTFISRQRCILK